jgi:hypothetical protein
MIGLMVRTRTRLTRAICVQPPGNIGSTSIDEHHAYIEGSGGTTPELPQLCEEYGYVDYWMASRLHTRASGQFVLFLFFIFYFLFFCQYISRGGHHNAPPLEIVVAQADSSLCL